MAKRLVRSPSERTLCYADSCTRNLHMINNHAPTVVIGSQCRYRYLPLICSRTLTRLVASLSGINSFWQKNANYENLIESHTSPLYWNLNLSKSFHMEWRIKFPCPYCLLHIRQNKLIIVIYLFLHFWILINCHKTSFLEKRTPRVN